MIKEKILAWCVHFYTATGLLTAAAMAVLIVRGDNDSLRIATGLMVVTIFIDSTDGWLARRARVKEVLPEFDGRRLDDIIDFQTYATLPLLFIWRAGILPGRFSWFLIAPLLASAYGFSQTRAKTEDNYFLGFPSYWNVVAIYLYWLSTSVGFSLALILALAVLTFIPSLYLYPSRGGPLNKLSIFLTAVWIVLLIMVAGRLFDDPVPVVWVSLGFPVYYFILSWLITLLRWSGKSGQMGAGAHKLELAHLLRKRERETHEINERR